MKTDQVLFGEVSGSVFYFKHTKYLKTLSDNETFQHCGRCISKVQEYSSRPQSTENKGPFVALHMPPTHAVSVPLPSLTAQMTPRCFVHVTSAHHTWLQNLRKTKNTVKCDRHLWTSAHCVKMDEKSLTDLTLTYLETKARREWCVSC